MITTLVSVGLVCILAAIVGGGLKGFGIEIPVLSSLRRQLILAVFGIVLLLVAGLCQKALPVMPPKPAPPGAIALGTWSGTYEPMPIIFHIAADGSATADSPTQGLVGTPVAAAIHGDEINLSIQQFGVVFSGQWTGNNMAGTFVQNGLSAQINFVRTGPAGETAAGDWEGTLTLPPLLMLNIVPGGADTCDIPSRGLSQIPATVTQTGHSITVLIPAIPAKFVGTLQGNAMQGTISFPGGLYKMRFTKS